MNTSIENEIWFKQILEHTDNVEEEFPHWLRNYRSSARESAETAIVSGLLPNRKQEGWRYTSLQKLQENTFYLNFDHTEDSISLKREWLSGVKSHRVVFNEGRFDRRLSDLDGLPESCFVGSLAAAMDEYSELICDWVGKSKANQSSIFSKLNNAMFKDGLFIYLPQGMKLEHPIEVLYLSGSGDKLLLSQPHNMVILETGVEATLTERFISINEGVHFNNYVSEVFLGKQAVFNHIQIQQQNNQSYYLNHLGLSLQSESDYRGTFLAMGAAMARTELSVDFKEPQAKCTLNGLYTVVDEQVVDFHLDINHGISHCHSETHFKGILLAKGRAVFDGSIVIEKDAQKSQAHLSNKNLLLSRKAEVDSKPQLEIYADDVQCSHGTTIGQLEEEQVFYLRSRGFSEAQARRLLAMGFAKSVLDNIEIEPISEQLEQLIEGRLTLGDTQ